MFRNQTVIRSNHRPNPVLVRRFVRQALAPSLLCALVAGPASADVFTVGAAGACTHEDLQDAIQAAYTNDTPTPTADIIRLSPNERGYYGEYEVFDQQLTISGGYADCDATSPSPGVLTKIARPDGARHFTVHSTGIPAHVSLENLNLLFDEGTPSEIGEGGSIHLSGRSVFIDGEDGAHLVLGDMGIVWQNQAKIGGGIACRGEGGITMHEVALVLDNKAGVAGGGLYLEGCSLQTYPQDPWAGVMRNLAQEGGGIFATAGSRVDMLGNVLQNTAGNGGGALVEGEGSIFIVAGGLVADNVATFDGAGIHARAQSNVSVFNNVEECTDLSRCGALTGNKAIGVGAALYVADSTAYVRSARVADNGADLGAVAVVKGASAYLDILSSEIVGNSSEYQIRVDGGATFRARHLTVGDNQDFDPRDGDTWYLHNMPSDSEIHNTIFWDEDGLVHDAFLVPTSAYSCFLVPDITLDPGTPSPIVGNPAFVDEAARDFRLGLNSDAVDLCRPSLFPEPDRLRNSRVVDDPFVPNTFGAADAGAFERR